MNQADLERLLSRLGDAWAEVLLEIAGDGNKEEVKEGLALMRNSWHEDIVNRMEADVNRELEDRKGDVEHDDTEPERGTDDAE